jgi:hypothetical protein
MLESHENIDDDARQHVIRFLDGDEQSMKVLNDTQKDPESKSVFSWVRSLFERDAKKRIFTTSDSHFLANLSDFVAKERLLQPVAEKAHHIAQTNIHSRAQTLLNKLTPNIQSIFQNALFDHVHREATHNDEQRRKTARKAFVQAIEKHSQASPSSYVILIIASCSSI